MAFRKFMSLSPEQEVWFDTDHIISMVRNNGARPPYTMVTTNPFPNFYAPNSYNVLETPEDIRAPGPE